MIEWSSNVNDIHIKLTLLFIIWEGKMNCGTQKFHVSCLEMFQMIIASFEEKSNGKNFKFLDKIF